MLPGVGQVVIFGEQKYAPTVQVNPAALAARGLGIDGAATAITNNTVEQPVGTLQGPQHAYQIGANGQLLQPRTLSKVIIAYRNGAPVRIKISGGSPTGRTRRSSSTGSTITCAQSSFTNEPAIRVTSTRSARCVIAEEHSDEAISIGPSMGH